MALLVATGVHAQVFGGGVFSAGAVRPAPGGSGPPPEPTLVGIGDSIMQLSQLPERMRAVLGNNWSAINQGVSGETAAQISARWFASEAGYCDGRRCSYVYVEGGINSLKGGGALPPATVLSTMLSIVDDALAKGYIVIWQDVLPMRGWPFEGVPVTDATIDGVLAYNAGMQAACAARASNPRLRCFFAYNDFLDTSRLRADGVTPAGYLLPWYSADELHLSPVGSQALADLAVAALEG